MTRPPGALAAALSVLLGLLLVVGAAPANAHDTLTGSSPADGTELAESPTEVALTFSNEVLATSPAVVVTDDAGSQITDAAPQVAGATVTLPLAEPLAAGSYTVMWSVVSSDGHRIEGQFGFSVAGGAAAPSAAGSDEVPTPDVAGPAESAPAKVGEATPSFGDIPRWVYLVLAIGGFGAVLAVAIRNWPRK